MQTGVSIRQFYVSCRNNGFILAFLWIAGFFSGIWYAYVIRTDLSSLMYTAAMSRVSIIGLITINFLPLFISAAAVYYSIPILIDILFILKSFSFGFSLIGFIFAFRSSGWLFHFFLAFSDSIMIVFMIFVLLRYRSESLEVIYKDFYIWLWAATVISLVDYFYISPFLLRILE